MKKFIALVALVLVSASTLMYAQESQRDIRRADRKLSLIHISEPTRH